MSNGNKDDALSKLLDGSPSSSDKAGSYLVTIYKNIIRGYGISAVSWSEGLSGLVAEMFRNGEAVSEGQKRRNLADALQRQSISWDVFIQGLRLVIKIPKLRIISMKFQVVVKAEWVDTGEVEEQVSSLTVYEDPEE